VRSKRPGLTEGGIEVGARFGGTDHKDVGRGGRLLLDPGDRRASSRSPCRSAAIDARQDRRLVEGLELDERSLTTPETPSALPVPMPRVRHRLASISSMKPICATFTTCVLAQGLSTNDLAVRLAVVHRLKADEDTRGKAHPPRRPWPWPCRSCRYPGALEEQGTAGRTPMCSVNLRVTRKRLSVLHHLVDHEPAPRTFSKRTSISLARYRT